MSNNEGKSYNWWMEQKIPEEKLNNLFRTPDTLEDMQEIVRKSNPETMVIVAMVQNFLTKEYNDVVKEHNLKCDNLADDAMDDYDDGYQDGWEACIEKFDITEKE
jgi:hypothetical protein